MPRLRRLMLTMSGLPALLWAAIIFAVVRPQGDADYWWHLRVGEWIAGNGAIPHTDLFSWLADGPWTAHEWAGELLLYWLHTLTGVYGSIVLLGAVNLGAVVLMVSIIRVLRPATNGLALAALAVTAVFVATAIWLPRLQSLDLLFSLLALRVALGYLEQGERRSLWAMPLVMVAWVNLHGGGVAIYALLMGALVLGEWWNRQRDSREVVRPWRPLLISIGATLAAQSLNPVGLAIYLYPLSTVASPAMQSLIQEWQSPDFHTPMFRFAQAFIAAGLVGLLALTRVRDARAILLSAGLTFMFLQSGRYVGFLALISLALVAPWLLTAAEDAWHTLVGRPFLWREPGLHRPLRAGILLVVLALLVGRVASLPAAQAESLRQDQPVAAADWLADRQLDGRLFNDYDWGGYLSWRLDREVGFYGAADAFGDADLQEFGKLSTLQIDPRPYLEVRDVALVVTRSSGPLGHWLAASPEWRALYSDETATVFGRVTP